MLNKIIDYISDSLDLDDSINYSIEDIDTVDNMPLDKEFLDFMPRDFHIPGAV